MAIHDTFEQRKPCFYWSVGYDDKLEVLFGCCIFLVYLRVIMNLLYGGGHSCDVIQ